MAPQEPGRVNRFDWHDDPNHKSNSLVYVPDNLWANVVFSLLMVCAAFWHGWPRRTGLVRFGFWLVFVGAFNLAGLLTYLALNHTAVIRCGVCGKRRGLERTDCAGCKAQLVMPKGRETDLILLEA